MCPKWQDSPPQECLALPMCVLIVPGTAHTPMFVRSCAATGCKQYLTIGLHQGKWHRLIGADVG
eukprot:5460826-Amphidinium_carterae.1